MNDFPYKSISDIIKVLNGLKMNPEFMDLNFSGLKQKNENKNRREMQNLLPRTTSLGRRVYIPQRINFI